MSATWCLLSTVQMSDCWWNDSSKNRLVVCVCFYSLQLCLWWRGVWHRMTEKNTSESEQASREADRANRSLFMQELLLALMSESTDAVRSGVSEEQELCSSVEDLQLFDIDGLLSKSANSPTASSQHGSTSSLAGVCDDTDSALVTDSRPVEDCGPVSKESFGVGVGGCAAAGVACSKTGML